MNFELSNNATSENIFLVNLSNLDGYLSPLFYKSKPKPMPHAKKLKDIAIVNPTRPRPKFEPDELVPYVGLPETDEHSHEIVEVVMRPYREVAGRSVIYPNDILFARIEPSVFNKKYIEAKDLHGHSFSFTSTEFYIVESPSIDAQYLFFMFLTDYVYNQVKGKTTGSTGRRRLDPDVFAKLKIPVPSDNTIDEVVKIINYARALKSKKLSEAKSLIYGIDKYLLKELGISLPEKDESIEARIFTTTLSKLSGNNFSPLLYTDYNESFIEAISNGKYSIDSIKNIAQNIFQGVSQNLTNNEEYTLLKVKNIERFNRFNLNDVEYVKSVPDFKILMDGDIIAPFIGEAIRQYKFSVFNSSTYAEKATVDNNTGVIRLKNGNNPIYVAAVLMSSIGKQQIGNLIGGGVPFIGSHKISKIIVPTPSSTVQDKLAKEILAIYNTSLLLEQEADAALEKARLQVEEMILKP